MKQEKENFQIRDFFNRQNIPQLSLKIKKAYPDFDAHVFLKYALSNLETATYSQRKENIVIGLQKSLPTNFPEALKILLKVLPEPIEHSAKTDSMDRFIVAPLADFVGKYGLGHPELSLNGLYHMTRTFTAEWGIRSFLIHHKKLTMDYLHEWTNDPDPHVRRLVSEGSRPYLPWGKKMAFVEKDPETTLPLLRKLKSDDSEYVRRSVANHLNDLSKLHCAKIVEELLMWKKESDDINTNKLIRHALRTAVKRGHPKALSLLGYPENVDVVIENVSYPESVPFSGKFTFQFDLVSRENKPVNIMLDFIIHYQKANGITQPKVFKLKAFELNARASVFITKQVNFTPITTRKYYPGQHFLQFLINGQKGDMYPFILEAE